MLHVSEIVFTSFCRKRSPPGSGMGVSTTALVIKMGCAVLLSPKLGVKLNTKVALKSRHSLLRRQMRRGALLLMFMPYVASPQAYTTLLHARALSFPECSYIFSLFPGTNHQICIVIMHAACVSVGLPWGPRWYQVVSSVVEEVCS